MAKAKKDFSVAERKYVIDNANADAKELAKNTNRTVKEIKDYLETLKSEDVIKPDGRLPRAGSRKGYNIMDGGQSKLADEQRAKKLKKIPNHGGYIVPTQPD